MPGPQWQDNLRLTDPKILALAKKVKMIVAPEYAEYKKTHPWSFYARVEIDLKDGRTVSDMTISPRGTAQGESRLTDEELETRFCNCAAVILPNHKIREALEIIKHLEEYDSLEPLMNSLTL